MYTFIFIWSQFKLYKLLLTCFFHLTIYHKHLFMLTYWDSVILYCCIVVHFKSDMKKKSDMSYTFILILIFWSYKNCTRNILVHMRYSLAYSFPVKFLWLFLKGELAKVDTVKSFWLTMGNWLPSSYSSVFL